MSNKKYVTYEEFGAVGDGVHDDFFAIREAHAYANENGLPVKACDTATYYIHETRVDGEPTFVSIKTDTFWGDAQFIIDDTDISCFKSAPTYPLHKSHVFKVLSDYPTERIEDAEILSKVLPCLHRGSERIDLKFDYPVMIIPYNSKHTVYRRKGYGGFGGFLMHECIVLDKDGNIDKDTPVMFDYNALDYIEVYRLDIKPITIDGGTFTTRASRVNNVVVAEDGTRANYTAYILRGIQVLRSFTTVKNVKHYVTGELELSEQVKNGEIVCVGYGYHGFFAASKANEITFEGCVLTGRRCYHNVKGGHLGTYDLTGNEVNKIIFKNCTQSNFWIKFDENLNITPAKEGEPGATTSLTYKVLDGITVKVHWGIGGTNFCKNMEYIGCTLSRFDAHCGLYHGKIIDSTINGLEVVGMGNLIMENTRWFGRGGQKLAGANNAIFYLRDDYASTWEGEMVIKNVKAYAKPTDDVYVYIFTHTYNNWDYGYQAYFPNLTVENLRYFDPKTKEPLPEGTEIRLVGNSLEREPMMHAEYTLRRNSIFPDVDEDGDGLVDGTNIPYDDYVDHCGVTDPTSFKNHNPVIPPKYIKILGNGEVKYKYVVQDTSEYEDGGFFGKTEFITENGVTVGTSDHSDQNFDFRKIEAL